MTDLYLILFSLSLGAYLIGSVPMAILVARAFGGVDPRKFGSGNIGATNVARTTGKTAGIITLVLDALKGALPTLFATYVFRGESLFEPLVCLVALLTFLGHLFPVYLFFRGGKGVATAVGLYLVISPLSLLLSFVIFVVVLFTTRYVSVASISSAIVMPIFLVVFMGFGFPALLGVIMAVLIIVKHRANLGRVIKGTESKFGKKLG
ncbi:MAG: glycerol-3-phosphate 1-O-acyltransferase PlsY [Deltaproteobacteria bacterium]|nr:glycerol-3-phosphate 1-O-acyltransferase PlsY [Deltaproteobacteria bacterium]